MTKVAEPINQLIKKLAKLPGVGGKTASRLALYILRSSKEEAYDLARSIVSVKEKITFCSVCYNLTDENPCKICKDEKRDKEVI